MRGHNPFESSKMLVNVTVQEDWPTPYYQENAPECIVVKTPSSKSINQFWTYNGKWSKDGIEEHLPDQIVDLTKSLWISTRRLAANEFRVFNPLKIISLKEIKKDHVILDIDEDGVGKYHGDISFKELKILAQNNDLNNKGWVDLWIFIESQNNSLIHTTIHPWVGGVSDELINKVGMAKNPQFLSSENFWKVAKNLWDQNYNVMVTRNKHGAMIFFDDKSFSQR